MFFGFSTQYFLREFSDSFMSLKKRENTFFAAQHVSMFGEF